MSSGIHFNENLKKVFMTMMPVCHVKNKYSSPCSFAVISFSNLPRKRIFAKEHSFAVFCAKEHFFSVFSAKEYSFAEKIAKQHSFAVFRKPRKRISAKEKTAKEQGGLYLVTGCKSEECTSV